ncbi:unnamed protein product [Urochloa humidicola]
MDGPSPAAWCMPPLPSTAGATRRRPLLPSPAGAPGRHHGWGELLLQGATAAAPPTTQGWTGASGDEDDCGGGDSVEDE